MKKLAILALVFILAASVICLAEKQTLLMDDFEDRSFRRADGTVDFGAGNGSSVQVTAATDIKNTGKQSIKVDFDAVAGGYMYIAKGEGLDAKNAGWLVKPKDIKWDKYGAISFYMYGTDSGTDVAFDIKDNGNELWRFMVKDDTKGWKQVICSFDKFFCRGDWQPDSAEKNATLDFPVKSFQFEPRPKAKGTFILIRLH